MLNFFYSGQIYLNADGTIYRHNPNQTLPASVSFNPAAPVFSQHQFMMDTRQYPVRNTFSFALIFLIKVISLLDANLPRC